MSDEPFRSSTIRVSLRELLALFAALAIGCASLRYVNAWWQGVVISLAFAAVIAAIVFALVDRGRRRAFAIGFLGGCLGYGALVLNSRTVFSDQAFNNEMNDLYFGRLPTTEALWLFYNSVVQSMWTSLTTHEMVAEQDLPSNAEKISGFGGGGFRGTPNSQTSAPIGANRFVRYGESPPLRPFMLLGHMLWALLLGYVGGKFAQFVYARRMREPS